MSDLRPNIDYVQLCKALEEGDKVTAQNLILNDVDVNNLDESNLDYLDRILCEIHKMSNIFFLEIFTILLDDKGLEERHRVTIKSLMLNDDDDDNNKSDDDNVNDSNDDSVNENNNDSVDDNVNDPNTRHHCNWTGTISKALDVVKKILNLKTTKYAINYNKNRLLKAAIQNNNTLGVCVFMRKISLLGEDLDEFLLDAIKQKNDMIVKMLIDHEVQNNPSIDLKTPLNAAISQGQLKMIELIIPHCQFLKPCDQYIPKKVVIEFGQEYKDCVKLLLKWNFTVSPNSNNDNDFIYAAIRKGYLPIVLQLLTFGIDVNWVNSNTGLSLLKVACLNKHHEIVENLLKHNACINVTTPTNTKMLNDLLNNHHNYPSLFIYNHKDLRDITCLHIAVLNSDLTMTKLLLKYGATIIDDPRFFNIACIAVQYNSEEIVRLFLDHGLDVNHIDLQGKTLLSHCVSSFSTKQDLRYKIAELLLEKEKERKTVIYIQTPGNTFVFDAIKNGYREIAQLFLDNDANIQYISPDGNTLLHKAIENDFDVEFIKTLLKLYLPINAINVNRLTPLLIACQMTSVNQLEIIKTLLHYNADVNCADRNLMTPLHIACQFQNLELVTVLLQGGANPNAKNHQSQTPLHVIYGLNEPYIPAQKYENILSIIQLLVQYNADIEAVDAKGRTPLFGACESIHEEAVEYLLDNHANANHIDLENLTPFYVAVQNSRFGDFQAVDILLKRKVNVHCIDKLGKSTIHLVVKHDTIEIIKSFFDTQINFNSVNKQGNTPLHTAVKKQSVVMTKSLIKYGANVNILDKDNCTPLRKAIEYVAHHRNKLDNHDFIHQWCKSEYIQGDIDSKKNFYTCIQIHPYKKIIRIIKIHIAKLITAGLKVNKQNLDLFHNSDNYDASDDEGSDEDVAGTEDSKTNILQLELKCEQEIEKMKMENIGVSNMTLYDLLTKNIHLLSRWVKNKKIKNTLELQVYGKKFPLYINIMRSRFRDAKFRYRLMNSARRYFSLYINQKLADDCIDTVFSYLNIKEIKMFIRAMKPLDG